MRVAHATETIEYYVARHDMASFLNDDMLAHLQLFHFPAYTNVFYEEDEQHYFYFLVEGQVQCSHYHENGKLAVLALSTPFTALGDLEILSEQRVRSNVVATKDAVMLGLPIAIVERYGADDPRFLRFLIDQLRDKLYKQDALYKHQVLPVVNRLAVYILSQQKSTGADEVELPAKEDLASLLGVTSRHLNRVLRELVEAGTISATYPCVRVLDEQALQAL
jgi:CRP-like cAMP-binding protein